MPILSVPHLVKAFFAILLSFLLGACGNLYTDQEEILADPEGSMAGGDHAVLLSATTVSATEGGATGRYTIALATQPTADVTVTLAPGAQLATDQSELVFNSADWNVPQEVTVTARDDTEPEGNHSDTIEHTVASEDGAYDGLAAETVTVELVDNDAPGVSVSPINLAVSEGGGPASYQVVLTLMPTSDVTITVTPGSEVSATPLSLTFTTGNWETPQDVTVAAIDDLVVEGAQSEVVAHAVTSADASYDGIGLSTVDVSIADNDAYSVVYDPNGATSGAAPVDGSDYQSGDVATIPANTGHLVKVGSTFLGWNTQADGSGTSYVATDTLTMGTSSITLYAEWGNPFAGGSGTAGDPYLIATAEHLNNIRSEFQTVDAHFRQTADIDLGVPPWNDGAGWDAISVSSAGDFLDMTYDGNGFVITGLFINAPTSSWQGLFGRVSTGIGATQDSSLTLNNVAVVNANVTGRALSGTLVGFVDSGDTISIGNSYATGTVTVTDVLGQAGGLVGRTWVLGSINSSFADVAVSASGVGDVVGGLVGDAGVPVYNSYALGDVSGVNSVGGLVGEKGDALENSYSTGLVTSTGTNVGGLVGADAGAPVVATSFYNQDTALRSDTGKGTPATTAEMITQSTYTGWDFVSTWAINDGTSYPYHQWYTGAAPTP